MKEWDFKNGLVECEVPIEYPHYNVQGMVTLYIFRTSCVRVDWEERLQVIDMHE